MTKFYLEFSNIAPHTLESREVSSTSIDGIEIPSDAVQFCFFDERRTYVAPHYWVTETVDRGGLDELLARHPAAHSMFDDYAKKFGLTEFAIVTWRDPDGRYDVNAVMPITTDFAFVDRATGQRLFA
jgi:hypothetical protein|nr:hypothetical protein [Neorhizobium tomejilense]